MSHLYRVALLAFCLLTCDAFAGTNQWTATGPQGGNVRGVRYASGGVALAIGNAGVYRSADHGMNWSRVVNFDSPSVNYGREIAVNPANDSQVIVLDSVALHLSNDRGLTWTKVTNIAGTTVNALNPQTLCFARVGGAAWLGSRFSAYRSLDGGLTWHSRSGGLPGIGFTNEILQLEVDATDANILYLLTVNTPWVTTDGGASWVPRPAPEGFYRLAPSRQVAGTLLAFSVVGQPHLSTNYGVTWAPGAALTVDIIKYVPGVAGRAHAISRNGVLQRTDDDGANWTAIGIPPQLGILDFDIDPQNSQRVLVTASSSMQASSDGGVTWQERNRGIDEADVAGFAVSRGANAAIYAGTFDQQRAWRRDAASGNWTGVAAQSQAEFGRTQTAYALAVSPADGNTLYMAVNGQFGRSTDGGLNWMAVGALPGDVTALVMDPSNALVGYAISANTGLLKTIDGGVHWQSVGGGVPPRVMDVIVDPQDSNNLYVAADYLGMTAEPVFRSTNGGTSWSPAATGIDTNIIWRLKFQPGSPAVLYAGTLQKGLFKTTNGGGNWTQITNPAFYSNAFNFEIDPLDPQIIYVADSASSSSPARSVDGGATWEPLRTPDLDMLHVALVPGKPSLLAGYFRSGGVYEMEIAPDLELTTTATAPLFTGIVQTVKLRARNTATFSATATVLTATLPAATGNYSVQTGAGSCSVAAQAMTCTLGILRAGASVDVDIGFTPAGPQQPLAASLAAREPDTVAANNTVMLATERRADLAALLTSSANAAQTGAAFSYTLTIGNAGPSPAVSVAGVLQLPANVSFASAAVNGLACSHAAGVVTCNAAAVDAGQSASATITVNAVSAGAANAALTVSGDVTDPAAANNSAAKSVTLTDPPAPPPPPPPPPPAPSPPSRSGGGGSIDYLLLSLLAGLALVAANRRRLRMR